jgi:hypothetical protein
MIKKTSSYRGATEGRHRNLNLLRIIKSINADIPLPPAILEALGSVLQNDFVALLDVDLNDERNHKPLIASPWGEKKHTVLLVTCCLNVGMFSASIGDSSNSERSSTAFSRSLFHEMGQMYDRTLEMNVPLIILKQLLLVTLF